MSSPNRCAPLVLPTIVVAIGLAPPTPGQDPECVGPFDPAFPNLAMTLVMVDDEDADESTEATNVTVEEGVLRLRNCAAAAGFFFTPIVRVGLVDFDNYVSQPGRVAEDFAWLEAPVEADLLAHFPAAEVVPGAPLVHDIAAYHDYLDSAIYPEENPLQVHEWFQPILRGTPQTQVLTHFDGYYHRWGSEQFPNPARAFWDNVVAAQREEESARLSFTALAHKMLEHQAALAGTPLPPDFFRSRDFADMTDDDIGRGIQLVIQAQTLRGTRYDGHDWIDFPTIDDPGGSLPGLTSAGQGGSSSDPPTKSITNELIVTITRLDPGGGDSLASTQPTPPPSYSPGDRVYLYMRGVGGNMAAQVRVPGTPLFSAALRYEGYRGSNHPSLHGDLVSFQLPLNVPPTTMATAFVRKVTTFDGDHDETFTREGWNEFHVK